MKFKNKVFINQILLNTLFKHKLKNKRFLTLNQNYNSVQPTILFISMFVCKNFFTFRGKFLTL